MRFMRMRPTAALAIFLSAVAVHRTAAADVSNDPDRVAKALERYGSLQVSQDFAPDNKTVYQTDFEGVTWDNQNWLLSTTQLEQGRFQTRGSIANGYFGINVASVGPFFELDQSDMGGDEIHGWPLFSRRQTFATIAGFFDAQPDTNGTNFPWLLQYGYESVISGVPHWSGLIIDLGNGVYLDSTVDNKTISNFRSTYDFKAGVLSWTYTWTPAGNISYDIRYLLLVSKLQINSAVVDLEIVASADSNATIVNVMDGYSAVRTDFVDSGEDDGAIYTAVRPNGVSNVTAYIYANLAGDRNVDLCSKSLVTDKPYVSKNGSSIAESAPVTFYAGKTVRITKYVGAASSDAFEDPQSVAKNAASNALAQGFYESLRAHVEEWAAVMPDDSVDSYAMPDGSLPNDSYVIDSAVIAVANPYYLLQNTVGPNAQALAAKNSKNASINVDSISVGGLTSDSYAGLVFWDADLFMQPGIMASHPESAKRTANYRINKYGQAKANAQTSFTSSQNMTQFSESAAAYPWTSGRYGNCTGTGPCFDYEYHLNGDIGISLINQLVATGDTEYFKDSLFPIYDSIATFFSNLLVQNGSSWTVTNMTDPDEYANSVDAGGYTMPLIAETLQTANALRKQFGGLSNNTWDSMAANVLVLRENGVSLEFSTMNGSAVVKQADVILNTFPLSYTTNYTKEDALNDLDYYANKQSPDGPAMTWAFFSIVANDISPSGCSAYTYSQYAYKPYARAPFYQLSEQLIDDATENGGTHPAFPFLTGHGGANQVTIFGYLGLRLLPDDTIHISPNLPPQLTYLRYRTIYWQGWPIKAWSNQTHTTLERATDIQPLQSANQRFANSSINVDVGFENNSTTYQLTMNGPTVVPNRNIGAINTVPGDLLQCRPATSSDAFRPGQFPIAATDGASSTKWQPEFADNLSSITVTLDTPDVGTPVSSLYFNWAQFPPVNATVLFHNSTLDNAAILDFSNDNNADFKVVASLQNITVSDAYSTETTDLDAIQIPGGNTTNVTLSEGTYASQYATLIIFGNQGLFQIDIDNKNGTGATVAEWAIISDARIEQDQQSSPARRRRSLAWRDQAMLQPRSKFNTRRTGFSMWEK